MWYVYLKNLKTEQEVFIQAYDNAEDAIRKIASNYRIDKELGQIGEYYYFMKKR